MYHGPKMCRTCLQMSRGDFKFVSLESVDPLWESNSPNLKAQLMSLVPEMKIDESNAYICTSCFIALRTAFEFKRMCQATEKKFQSYNYKYRRPFGVGPGSPQFHVTLNENRVVPQTSPAPIKNSNNTFHSQKLNYLQADTSIDITEHHLYDASKSVQRRVQYVNPTPKPPENELLKAVLKQQDNNIPKKVLNSQQLKEKFNLGSQISIVQTEKGKPSPTVKTETKPIVKCETDEDLIKLACEQVEYLKENQLGPSALNCHVQVQVLTEEIVKTNVTENASLDNIKSISHEYYFDVLQDNLACQFCTNTFSTRFLFQMHQYENHADQLKPSENTKTEEKPSEPPSTTGSISKSVIVKRKVVRFRLRKYCRCFICNKICFGPLHLLRHCKYIHIPRYSRKRNLLKKSIKQEEDLYSRKLRVRTSHAFVSQFRCSICDKGFGDEKELEVHMYVHTPVIISMDDQTEPKDEESERLFKCYLCGKSFLKERFLKLHNIQMHLRNKLTTCKNCGRSFKSEFWYERHKCVIPVSEETAPEDTPDDTNMYPCSFCERKFSQLRFMKIHRHRAHKNLLTSRGPRDKLSTESPILEGTKDSDPMELYTIAGTSSTVDESGEPEDSESDGDTDVDDQVDSTMDDNEEEYIPETKPTPIEQTIEEKPIVKTEIVPTDVIQDPPQPPPIRRGPGRPPLIRDQKPIVRDLKPPVETAEPEGPGRRGNRGMPKIQCDFCGELLDENRYDKHIAEHNKSRLQRRISTTTTHVEEYDSDEFPLKCPVCYKGFKRKYYYNIHINKHIEEGIDVQEEPVSPVNDNPTTPTPSQPPDESRPASEYDSEDESYGSEIENCTLEEDDIQGEEVVLKDNSKFYVCCGRSFRLKAHFFRHYKIKHPNNHKKKHPIKFADSPDITSSPIQNELDILEVPKVSNLVDIQKVQNLPDLTIVQTTFVDPKKAVAEKPPEPVTTIKPESDIPNDLEIGLKEDMDIKAKRRLSDAEVESVKKLKTENPEAVKLRNTVAAHLDDIEIVPVSPSAVFKYECTQCDKKFRQKSQLRDHHNVHSGAKPYMCEFCQPSHGFTQSSSLYFHIRKVHSAVMKNVSWAIQSKSGLCLVCLEVFEKHVAMYKHLRQNYVENGFDCEMCSKNVTMTCHYKAHNLDPTDMDSFILPQQNLEILLTEDNESRTSSQASIADDPEFDPDESINEADAIMRKARRCDPCGKIFKSLQYYNLHVKGSVHQQRVDFLANGGSKTELEEVPKEAEEPEKEDQPSIASDETIPADIERTEEALISKEDKRKFGTFKCPTCSKLFRTKTHLRKHRRTQHYVYAMHKRHTHTDAGEEPALDAGNPDESTLDEADVTMDDSKLEEATDGETTLNSNEDPILPIDKPATPSLPEPSSDTQECVLPGVDSATLVDDTDTPMEDTVNETIATTLEVPSENSVPQETNSTSLTETEAHSTPLTTSVSVEPVESTVSERPLNIFENDSISDDPIATDTDLDNVTDVTQNTVEDENESHNIKDMNNSRNEGELLKPPDFIEAEKPPAEVSDNNEQILEIPLLIPVEAEEQSNEIIKDNQLEDPLAIPIEHDHQLDESVKTSIDADKQVIEVSKQTPEISKAPKIDPQQPPDFPKGFISVKKVSELNKMVEDTAFYGEDVRLRHKTKESVGQPRAPSFSPVSHQNEQFVSAQHAITPPAQHLYSNQHPLDNRGNLHLSPKYYRGEQFVPHYPQKIERLSHPYSDYQQMNPHSTNYYAAPQPHSTFMQSPRADPPQSSSYTRFFEQGFVLQDEELLDKGLNQNDSDINPEQELLALLHNSNSVYDKRPDGNFDTEQEFIDLESAGSKILRKSFEGLDEGVVNADTSRPDPHDLLYRQGLNNTESVDFNLPHINEMTHNFR